MIPKSFPFQVVLPGDWGVRPRNYCTDSGPEKLEKSMIYPPGYEVQYKNSISILFHPVKMTIILTVSSVTEVDFEQNPAFDWISLWHWSWLTWGMLLRFSASNSRAAWSASSWCWCVYVALPFLFCVGPTDSRHKNTVVLAAAEWFERPTRAVNLFMI